MSMADSGTALKQCQTLSIKPCCFSKNLATPEYKSMKEN